MNRSRYASHQPGDPFQPQIPIANSFPLRASVVNSTAFSRIILGYSLAEQRDPCFTMPFNVERRTSNVERY